MYLKFMALLDEMYKEDQKKLRTGTILYGNVYDSRWQTHIQRPLSIHELNEFENKYGKFPSKYKELLLITNGCYLFDLIRVAGKTDSTRGMTIEEQNEQPCSLEDLQIYLDKEESTENLFIFADSMVRGSFFAFNENDEVVEFNDRNLKVMKTYESLDELLYEIFAEGIEMVSHNEYIEFD